MAHLEAAATQVKVTGSLAVKRGAGEMRQFRTAPGILIYPTEGSIARDGSKVARTPGTPHGIRYRHFRGEIGYAVRFLARSDEQLTEMVNQFLAYLATTRLHDAEENHIAVPSGEIRFAWRDPEGLLIGDHAVELLIPADAALYSDRERQLVDIRVSYKIATSLEGEESG